MGNKTICNEELSWGFVNIPISGLKPGEGNDIFALWI